MILNLLVLAGLRLVRCADMSAIISRQYRRTTLQLWAFLAVLAGLGFGYFGFRINFLWLAVTLFLGLSMRRKNGFKLLLVILLAFGLGWWRGIGYNDKIAVYDHLYDQKLTIVGQANEDANYNKYKQISFSAGNLRLEDGTKIPGKILVSGYGANSVLHGDKVVITGKMRPGYGTNNARMSYAQLSVVEHNPTLIADLRRNFIVGMQNALPEPAASFGMGLLVGQRVTLPEEVKQDLLMVGLTHIIAVSGYNLTIILRATGGLFAKQSKRLTVFFAVGLIFVFLLITGSSASIVRAAIVSMLSISAAYYGRSIKPLNLIALAAAITAWANPMYIWADLGWYLSFLAFYGVLVLAPLMSKRLTPRLRKSIIAMIALETICAEIMTMPFVLFNFGQVSLIGLLANVLVVVFIPLAMLLSLIAGLGGMLFSSLAGWIALPAKILLTYMLDIAHILSDIPNVFIENISLSLSQMLTMYALVVFATILLWFKANPKSDTITDKNDDNLQGVKV